MSLEISLRQSWNLLHFSTFLHCTGEVVVALKTIWRPPLIGGGEGWSKTALCRECEGPEVYRQSKSADWRNRWGRWRLQLQTERAGWRRPWSRNWTRRLLAPSSLPIFSEIIHLVEVDRRKHTLKRSQKWLFPLKQRWGVPIFCLSSRHILIACTIEFSWDLFLIRYYRNRGGQFETVGQGDFPVFWGIFSINWTEGLKLLITADVFSWSLSESSDNAEMPIILPGRVVGSVTK